MGQAKFAALARGAEINIRQLTAEFGLDAKPGSLFLVTGGGEWAVKEIALGLKRHLKSKFESLKILSSLSERRFLSQANVHCLCRPAFFGSVGVPAIHHSNRLVVSWLHGGKNSADSNIVAACTHLEKNWKKVRRFIVPNSVTYQHVLECGVDPKIVHVIPNGIDIRKFYPATECLRLTMRSQLGIAAEAFVVGSFQRDEDDQGKPKMIKGPDILVDALAALSKKRPVFALLTGPSRNYVRKGLDEAGIPYRYENVPSPDEQIRRYAVLDAYLVSSREEGGPAALRESMASGVAVVSTRMGLAVDLIQHGRNGLIAEVGDAAGLAGNLLLLMDKPALRKQLAEEALKDIKELDFSIIAGRYHNEVYRYAFSRG